MWWSEWWRGSTCQRGSRLLAAMHTAWCTRETKKGRGWGEEGGGVGEIGPVMKAYCTCRCGGASGGWLHSPSVLRSCRCTGEGGGVRCVGHPQWVTVMQRAEGRGHKSATEEGGGGVKEGIRGVVRGEGWGGEGRRGSMTGNFTCRCRGKIVEGSRVLAK